MINMPKNVNFGQVNYGAQLGINNGTVNIHIDSPVSLQGLLATASGASYDSKDAEHEELCLPGTRVEVLDEIQDWVSSDQSKCIFWLCGMAGTGKSTISRSVAHSLSEAQELGASFFFKRGEADRGNAKKLFPTIASQMACRIPGLLPLIIEAATENPDLAEKALKIQFDEILVKPLQKLTTSDPQTQRALAIVIDALDESEGDGDIRTIINLLPQLQKIDTVRLRVFVTSRPDLPLRLGFRKLADDDHEDLILHEIPRSIISNDISLYLNHQIGQIRDERDPPLPIDWPGQSAIEQLVDLSIPLFIFAATICRIFKENYWHPDESLSAVLAQKEQGGSQLDGTYLPILHRILNGVPDKHKGQVVEKFQHIVGTIILLESPLSVSSLSKLLRHTTNDIRLWLAQLHSVLRVSDDDDLPIRLFHLSFRDYLLDPETLRKTPLGVNKQERSSRLVLQCFDVCQQLHKNNCGLPNDGISHAEIDPLVIEKCLAPELQYACRYWSHHLMECLKPDQGPNAESDGILVETLLFLHRHFLHWLEVMSLLGLFPEVITTINLLQMNVPEISHPVLAGFLQDARRFIIQARQAADVGPLQIYCAALVFAPQTAVRTAFKSQLPPWITKFPQTPQAWGAEMLVVKLEGLVYSMAFSPDCRFVAAIVAHHTSQQYSTSRSIRIIDTTTGETKVTLPSSSTTNPVLAFHPSGGLLVHTNIGLEIWDIALGAVQETLEDFSKFAEDDLKQHKKAEFSPDGKILVWLCSDGSLQLWDVASRTPGHKLKFPNPELVKGLREKDDAFLYICFSSNNAIVMFADSYGEVWLWDVQTGHLIRSVSLSLSTHWGTGSSHRAIFSSDASMLCCSRDGIVLIYSLDTGELHHRLNFSLIRSMAFSPDNRSLAIAADNMVHIFDYTTGKEYQTLSTHWRDITAVCFSQDGKILASASMDPTIRLWTIQKPPKPDQPLDTTGFESRVSQFHSPGKVGRVTERLVISKNSHVLAFTTDKSIAIWDLTLGISLWDLDIYQHGSTVEEVHVSPDGSLLACSMTTFDDSEEHGLREIETLLFWNLSTGALQYKHVMGDPKRTRAMEFSPDSQILACSCIWNGLYLMHPKTETCRTIEVGEDNDLTPPMAFSPDSRHLASTHWNGTVKIWDVESGTVLQELKDGSGHIESLTFSPSSRRYLATSSSENLIILWDLSVGTPCQKLADSENTVHAVAISPDEKILASGCRKKDNLFSSEISTIQLWDMTSGLLRQTIDLGGLQPNSLRFSHDGSSLQMKNGEFKMDPETRLYSTTMPLSVHRRIHWVRRNGVKSLWLPVEFGASDCGVRGNTLAIGHSNGQVSIFKFAV